MIVVSVKIPAEVVRQLRVASADRSIDKAVPYQQADIVTEALSAWLKKNGYPIEGAK